MLNHRICMSPACIKSTYRLEFLSQSSLRSPSYSLPIGPGTSHRLKAVLDHPWLPDSDLYSRRCEMVAKRGNIDVLRGFVLFYGVNPDSDTLTKVTVVQCSISRNKNWVVEAKTARKGGV